MECFTAGFCNFYHKCQNLPITWPAVYAPSISSISEIFLKFYNFLRSHILSRSTIHEANHTFTF